MSKVTRNDGAVRTYTVQDAEGNEVRYPSVTSILKVIGKPALIEWAKKVVSDHVYDNFAQLKGLETMEQVGDFLKEARRADIKIRDTAANVGSLAHGEIERYVRKQITLEQANPAVQHIVQRFIEWETEVGFVLEHAERMVYSHQYQFAGTLDLSGIMTKREGKRAIIDIKTSSGIYPEMFLQVASYGQAVAEMDGKPVDEGWIVRLDKSGSEFEAKQVPNMQEAFNIFSSTYMLWRWLEDQKPPTKKELAAIEAAKNA